MSDERFYIDEHVLTLGSGREIIAWAMFDRDLPRVARFTSYNGAVGTLRAVRSDDFDPEMLTWRDSFESAAVLVPAKDET